MVCRCYHVPMFDPTAYTFRLGSRLPRPLHHFGLVSPSYAGLRCYLGGGGVLPYKGLMGMCGQSGYVFGDFCLKQGIDFIIFVLIRVSILSICLKQGIFSWTINSLRVCSTN